MKYRYLLLVTLSTALSVLFSVFVQYKRADLLDIAINKTDGFLRNSSFFVLFILLEILFTYLMNDSSRRYAIYRARTIRQDIYDNYLRVRKNLDSSKKSGLANTLIQQVDLLKERYISSTLLLIFLALKSIAIIVLMLRVNLLLTFLVILMLLTQILLPKVLGKVLSTYNSRYIQKLESFTKVIDEFMGAYKSIFIFSAQNFFYRRFHNSLDELCRAEYKNFFYNNLLRTINMFISYATHFIAILLCTYLLYRSILDIKRAYLLIGFVEQLSYPLIGISFAYQSVLSFKGTREKILAEALGGTPQIPSPVGGTIESIEIQKLNVSYDGRKILSNFSQRFGGKGKYLLKGKSGSGKTTLLKVLVKELDFYEGKVLINGSDLREEGIENRIGLMDDTPLFINDTLRNNILLGIELNPQDLEKSMEALGIDHLIERLEEPADSLNYEFSLGERKRIEFLRVLLRDFSVLLLDEPTSNVDEASKGALIEVLKGIEDKLILCTSHDQDPAFLALFDKVVEIERLKAPLGRGGGRQKRALGRID